MSAAPPQGGLTQALGATSAVSLLEKTMNKLVVLAILAGLAPLQAAAEDLSKCMQGWDATERGAYEQALALYDSCVKTGDLSEASIARTYRNIGITLRRANKPAEAVFAYDKAIALNPHDVADDYINQGNAYDEAGEFQKALDSYAKAIDINPGHGEAYYNRGIAYERQSMLEQAKADFLAAYKHGLRTNALYDRFVVHDLLDKVQ